MGQKYVTFNPSTGALLGFYDSEDHPPPSNSSFIEISYDEWQQGTSLGGCSVTNGKFIAPAPLAADMSAKVNSETLVMLTNRYIDSVAQSLGYVSMQDALTYLTSSNAGRKAKATSLFEWRDSVWDAADDTIANVKEMTLAMPDVPTFVDALPRYTAA